MASRPVSEEEAARDLGFVNVEAFQNWKLHKDSEDADRIRWLVAEMCNLKEEIKILKQADSDLSRRLQNTGTELIGGR